MSDTADDLTKKLMDDHCDVNDRNAQIWVAAGLAIPDFVLAALRGMTASIAILAIKSAKSGHEREMVEKTKTAVEGMLKDVAINFDRFMAERQKREGGDDA